MSNWFNEYRVWLSESQSLSNAQLVLNHFQGTDWSPQALAALCGNMRHESSINPDMYEYGYDWSADRGFGLVQWTPRSKYWDWAVNNGLDPRHGNSQLARIDYEVDHNIQWIPISRFNHMTFSEFRRNSGNWSIDYLTEAFTWCYERPNAQAGEESMPARQAFAHRVYNELEFGEGSGVQYPAFPTTDGLTITSPYGWRFHPIHEEYRFHSGIDIGGGGQTHPIYATMAGQVIGNFWHDSMGWVIRLEHSEDDKFSMYIHLNEQSPLSVGSQVTKGQTIGTMGTTGDSTGIHLHFEIATRSDGFSSESGTIDPELYLQTHYQGSPGGSDDSDHDKAVHWYLSQLRYNNHRRR